jgi:hypothetical protein
MRDDRSMRSRLHAWATAAAFAATTLAARAEPPRSDSCTMTLSGAVTGTFACVASVSWSASTSTGVVAIVAPHAAPLQSVNVAIERPGEPKTGTWKDGDEGVVAGLVVQPRGEPRKAWTASAGPKGEHQGSFTLTLTTVAPGTTTKDGKGYDARGSLTATLTPERSTRAAGTVTLSARF